MDKLFKALADPNRRLLLDRLFVEDGQTLGELCSYLPEMTRYGVMNHLRVLEEAGLLATRRRGRNKHHYLNAVPIRLINDRWISKYTEPLVGAVADLKAELEGGTHMEQPAHIYQAFIRASRQEVWQALIDGDLTARYFYGTRVESSWVPGEKVNYLYPDGNLAADGDVVAFDPPNHLEMTFHARWDDELEAEGPVRVVWLVEDADGLSKLTVELHDAGPKTATEFSGGYPFIISGLKTLLETGAPLSAA